MNDPSKPNTRQTAGGSPQIAPQASGGPESARGATDAADGRTAPLDPTRRYLVPVAHLALADEPDDVHLSVYEWNPRLQEWLTGWAICGRSSTQGRLPDGTQATCAKCLEAKPGYDKVLAEQARAAAERAANPSDQAFPQRHEKAPTADELRDQLAEALRNAVCPGGCGKTEDECCKTRLQPVVWRHGKLDGIDGSPELIADAVLPVVQAELARVSALHADTERQLRDALADEVRRREAAEAAWTPPPPGDRREQLPEHLLALVGVPLYLSTACETAHRLDLYRTDSPHADECARWAERLHQRCRINNKFTGEACSCACHAPKENP